MASVCRYDPVCGDGVVSGVERRAVGETAPWEEFQVRVAAYVAAVVAYDAGGDLGAALVAAARLVEYGGVGARCRGPDYATLCGDLAAVCDVVDVTRFDSVPREWKIRAVADVTGVNLIQLFERVRVFSTVVAMVLRGTGSSSRLPDVSEVTSAVCGGAAVGCGSVVIARGKGGVPASAGGAYSALVAEPVYRGLLQVGVEGTGMTTQVTVNRRVDGVYVLAPVVDPARSTNWYDLPEGLYALAGCYGAVVREGCVIDSLAHVRVYPPMLSAGWCYLKGIKASQRLAAVQRLGTGPVSDDVDAYMRTLAGPKGGGRFVERFRRAEYTMRAGAVHVETVGLMPALPPGLVVGGPKGSAATPDDRFAHLKGIVDVPLGRMALRGSNERENDADFQDLELGTTSVSSNVGMHPGGFPLPVTHTEPGEGLLARLAGYNPFAVGVPSVLDTVQAYANPGVVAPFSRARATEFVGASDVPVPRVGSVDGDAVAWANALGGSTVLGVTGFSGLLAVENGRFGPPVSMVGNALWLPPLVTAVSDALPLAWQSKTIGIPGWAFQSTGGVGRALVVPPYNGLMVRYEFDPGRDTDMELNGYVVANPAGTVVWCSGEFTVTFTGAAKFRVWRGWCESGVTALGPSVMSLAQQCSAPAIVGSGALVVERIMVFEMSSERVDGDMHYYTGQVRLTAGQFCGCLFFPKVAKPRLTVVLRFRAEHLTSVTLGGFVIRGVSGVVTMVVKGCSRPFQIAMSQSGVMTVEAGRLESEDNLVSPVGGAG